MRENTKAEDCLFEAMNNLYNEFLDEREVCSGIQPYLKIYKVPLPNYVGQALVDNQIISRRKEGRKWYISWQSNERPTPAMAQELYDIAKGIKNGERREYKGRVTAEDVQESINSLNSALKAPELIDAHKEIERLNKLVEDQQSTIKDLHKIRRDYDEVFAKAKSDAEMWEQQYYGAMSQHSKMESEFHEYRHTSNVKMAKYKKKIKLMKRFIKEIL